MGFTNLIKLERKYRQRPNNDSLKHLKTKEDGHYLVIIETNTPQLVDYSKCDIIDNIVVQEQTLDEFIKSLAK